MALGTVTVAYHLHERFLPSMLAKATSLDQLQHHLTLPPLLKAKTLVEVAQWPQASHPADVHVATLVIFHALADPAVLPQQPLQAVAACWEGAVGRTFFKVKPILSMQHLSGLTKPQGLPAAVFLMRFLQ